MKKIASLKKIIVIALSVLVSASALSACGKRGALIAPEGSTYPQQYPKQ